MTCMSPDSDFFEPLFRGLFYYFSDIFLKLMLEHTKTMFKHIYVVLFIVVFRFSKKITVVPLKRTILGHIHHLTPWIRPIQDVFDICHQS